MGAITPTLMPATRGVVPATSGPLVGHVDNDEAVLWFRADQPGKVTLRIRMEPGGTVVNEHVAEASADNDLCVQWIVDRLAPSTEYRYSIVSGDRVLADDPAQRFRTAPQPGKPARVKLAVGSCALEDAASRDVWKRMAAENVDGVLLLGDTPYIDKTDLVTQRRRHREFVNVAEFQQLVRGRPFWGTWDDHDFGANDSDGTIKGKENVRRAFVEYRPQLSHGQKNEGIHQRFRVGPVEVFLLDTRWFFNTAPSYADPAKKTLLGKAQWDWLCDGLRTSAAPFKVLACGMIWDDKKNKESDDWGSFPHELDLLKQFIGDHRIPGVMLVGGDIHVSRILRYEETVKTVGYPLYQFISSPIHHRVIPSLSTPNPALVHNAIEPNVFMAMTFDDTVTPPTLHAELIRRDGSRVFEQTVTLADLSPAKAVRGSAST